MVGVATVPYQCGFGLVASRLLSKLRSFLRVIYVGGL
jgi:hypothetical protein